MKRWLAFALLCLAFGWTVPAQEANPDAPASKEDVERYLDSMHYHDMMKQMMEAMTKPMHQMVHEQFLKQQDKLPPDFEAAMERDIDGMLDDMPMDEMMQAMVPIYQKHFTKGDIDALVAFYSSQTGQKMLRELPTITAEAMGAMMPIMQEHIKVMQQRIQQDVQNEIEKSQKSSGQQRPATQN
jgi:hypothetical protein